MAPSVTVVTGFDCTFLLSYFRTLSIGPASCTSPSYSQTLYRVSLSFRFKIETDHRHFSAVRVLHAEPKCNLRSKRVKGRGEVGHGSRSPLLSSPLVFSPLHFCWPYLIYHKSSIKSSLLNTPPFLWMKVKSPPSHLSLPSPLLFFTNKW